MKLKFEFTLVFQFLTSGVFANKLQFVQKSEFSGYGD